MKTIKSDGKYFDVLINVKDTGNEQYIYDITLNEADSLPDQLRSYTGSSAASNSSISENEKKTIRFSLKNVNITLDADIPYVVDSSYVIVNKRDYKTLGILKNNVRKVKKRTYENRATGYKADVTSETINKIINPTAKFDPWSPNFNYIENLNAAKYLPELFENAVYVDSKPPQKAKNVEKQIVEYHHFVAPIEMNNQDYRVLITAREKVNSNTLYIVNVEVLNIKRGNQVAGQKPPNFIGIPRTIKIPDLVNGVKIYDYNAQKNNIYNYSDLKYSLTDVPDLDLFWEAADMYDDAISSSASILEEGAKAMQGKTVDTKLVRKIAHKMKQEYRSTIELDTLTDNLVKVFSYMQLNGPPKLVHCSTMWEGERMMENITFMISRTK